RRVLEAIPEITRPESRPTDGRTTHLGVIFVVTRGRGIIRFLNGVAWKFVRGVFLLRIVLSTAHFSIPGVARGLPDRGISLTL
ncbi:MAG TPA: hypothetical protein PL064_01565, partial [Thermogutta sp.]|nr:hypothetical protein [Thermogutta sp.]